MGVKVGFRKKEKGCSGGTIVGCGPDGHVGHGGSVGRCIASGCFEEDSMDFMPGIIHITVLAPSKKNRSAVRAIITHQPFCALRCCIVFCSHRFPMQAACAACFSLYPSVFVFQSISLYLLMRSVSYLQRLRKGQRTTHSPASADQAPVLDSRGQMGVVSNGADVVQRLPDGRLLSFSTVPSVEFFLCKRQPG